MSSCGDGATEYLTDVLKVCLGAYSWSEIVTIQDEGAWSGTVAFHLRGQATPGALALTRRDSVAQAFFCCRLLTTPSAASRKQMRHILGNAKRDSDADAAM